MCVLSLWVICNYFARQINSLRCQMATDRFKGSDESTVGNEIVRWQEKGVSLLSIELLDELSSFLRTHPANFLEKWLLQTTPFPSGFVNITNYCKA